MTPLIHTALSVMSLCTGCVNEDYFAIPSKGKRLSVRWNRMRTASLKFIFGPRLRFLLRTDELHDVGAGGSALVLWKEQSIQGMSSVSCVAIVSVKLKACAVVGNRTSTSSEVELFHIRHAAAKHLPCGPIMVIKSAAVAVQPRLPCRRQQMRERSLSSLPVHPEQAHRHHDATHPLLDGGCSDRGVPVSCGPQREERHQFQLSVNVLGTIQLTWRRA